MKRKEYGHANEACDPSTYRNNLEDEKIRDDRNNENKRQVHGRRWANLTLSVQFAPPADNWAIVKAVTTEGSEPPSPAEDAVRLILDTTPALIHTGRTDGYLDYFNRA